MANWLVLEIDTGPGRNGRQLATIRGWHSSRVKASGQRSDLVRRQQPGECVRFAVHSHTEAKQKFNLSI